MAVTTDNPVQTIRLKYGDTSRVLVETDGGHCIPTTQHEVVKNYKLMEVGLKEFARQWDDLKEILDEWWEKNQGLAKAAWVADKGEEHLFLVVMKGTRMNPELEESLSDLDIRIAQDENLNLIHLDAMAVPDFGQNSVQAFLPHIKD